MDASPLLRPDGYDSLRGLGFSILGVIAFILIIKETVNLIRGQHPDYKGVLVRTVIAGIMLAAVPYVANLLAEITLETSAFLQGRAQGRLEEAFRYALAGASCEGIGTFDGLGLLFTLRGWVILLSFAVLVGFWIIKVVVIDVAWKIVFSIMVFQAPLTLPLTAMSEFGGLATYWRNILGVALWPVTFAMLMSLVSVAFPHTIAGMADGKAKIDCTATPVVDAAGAGTTVDNATSPAVPADIWAYLKFLAIIVALAAMTTQVPAISAAVVGAGSPGLLGTGAIGAITGGAQRTGRASVAPGTLAHKGKELAQAAAVSDAKAAAGAVARAASSAKNRLKG